MIDNINSLKSSQYVVMGPPIPWKRAGVNHSKMRLYDKQVDLKLIFGIHLKNQHGLKPLFEGPLYIKMVFYMPIPKRHPKNHSKFHSITPDIDNLAKFVLDTSKGILFTDDRIVSSIKATKIYDETPRTEICIIEIK